jgi:hypothetical protein
MGVDAITVSSPQEERAVRAALNSYVRRAEVAQRDSIIAELQRKQVERDARDAAQQKWMDDPKYQAAVQRYTEIKESFGDEAASDYWRGIQGSLEQLTRQEYDERWDKVQQETAQRAGEAWKGEAWLNANQLPESIRTLPRFGGWFETAVQSFNAEIEMGHYPQLQTADDLHKEFVRFFSSRLTKEPDVVAVYRSLNDRENQQRTAAAAKAAEEERRIAKIKQDAIDEYKRQAGQRRTQAPPHPLGNLSGTARSPVPAGSEAAEPAADLSPNQLKKSLRSAAREDARRRFGG